MGWRRTIVKFFFQEDAGNGKARWSNTRIRTRCLKDDAADGRCHPGRSSFQEPRPSRFGGYVFLNFCDR